MAPIKFEENIREKLEERTIKPSEDAWNKLSERLDSNGHKKESHVFWWFSIAASVIGVLFFVTNFWNDDLEGVNSPSLVVEPLINQEIQKSEETLEVGKSESLEDEAIEIKKNLKGNVKLESDNNVVNLEEVFEEDVDLSNQIEKENLLEITEKRIGKISFEDQKIQEIVTQINTLQASNALVTEKTIDALLEKAQQEIIQDRIKKSSTGLVDAASLLESVEYELDESFRNKVFKALKDNLGKVKTAVAQRND